MRYMQIKKRTLLFDQFRPSETTTPMLHRLVYTLVLLLERKLEPAATKYYILWPCIKMDSSLVISTSMCLFNTIVCFILK